MKRIINGVTYNTDTSTVIAKDEVVEGDWADGGYGSRTVHTLYQTRGGAFFAHANTVQRNRDVRDNEWLEDERHRFEPMTRDEAHKWVMTGEVELFSDVFGEPPEAAAEEAPSATIYLRVPSSLKLRLEKLAADANISLNSWLTRCVERCAGGEISPAS